MERSKGQCAMQGSCGRKGWLGQSLPCPYNGPPTKPDTDELKQLLSSVCGPLFEDVPVCCTLEQVETLQASLIQAEGLISPCPACRNNFRSFYCQFTCSPDQGTFLNVSATQQTSEGLEAVKSVDFFVGGPFGNDFFDSCKNVKYGASNGFAMDLIGGGAKDYRSFLKFMGDEKPLGSPFQINYPESAPPEYTMFNPLARHCSDNDPSSHCSCTDCPTSCPALPHVPSPYSQPSCQVGSVTCLSFILLSTYILAIFVIIAGYFINIFVRRRREKTYERVALSGDPPPLSPSSIARGLVGASSLAQADGEDSSGGQSDLRLGRGASLLDPMESFQPRRYHLNIFLRRMFYRIGATCANYPWLTIAFSFIFVGLCNIGWKQFEVESDPVRLWVGPASESKLQKEYFDEHFGPFYRTEQIFVTPSDELFIESDGTDPALTWDRLKWWFDVEKDIRFLKSEPNGYTLEDICFKPAGPEGSCVVQSITGWFGNSLEKYNSTSWVQRVESCSSQPVNCLPDFQQPLMPAYILGSPLGDGPKNWLESRSLIITLVVMDSLENDFKEKAEEWERTLRAFLEQLSAVSVDEASSKVFFSTGVSLEEELNKSTNTDIRIVVLSYFVMFLYVALALGKGNAYRKSTGNGFKQCAVNLFRIFKRKPLDTSTVESHEDRSSPDSLLRRLFVESKFTLGIFGIFLVILSVSASVGLFSIIGVKVTLIIAEVIPFLVLAVGVDNVFILVHELDRQNLIHGPSASNNFSPAMFSPVSPIRHLSFESTHEDHVDTDSMPLHLSPEERVARTVAKMGPSILLSSLTETLAFALGALVPMPAVRNFALYAAGSVLINAVLQSTAFIGALTIDLRRTESYSLVHASTLRSLPDATGRKGSNFNIVCWDIHRVNHIHPTYSTWSRQVASLSEYAHSHSTLDQRLALPANSYLIPYFDALDMYFDVGPPVYFISQDVNVTSIPDQQHLCGRFTTCDEMSLVNILEVERNRPESSFISQPAASWIDDFLRWLDPSIDTCCRVRKRNSEQFCGPNDPSGLCKPCFQDRKPEWNITLFGMPEGDEFMKYLQQWLISPTNEDCPLGGRAAYGSALSLTADNKSVAASHFRTFHSPLKNQTDFINAFTAAHRIAEEISLATGTKVFPYSLFYVFFDQYAHIIAITQEILGLALGSVLLVTSFLLGSWRTGTIVTGVVALTVVSVMGVMGLWDISLNALSLVNLVISLGISVEFCAHIARAFMGAGVGYIGDNVITGQKERDERMWTALVDVGPSPLAILILSRMWFSLIISGALHGLVLLPVVLSLAGGPGYPLEDTDEEWMSNAIRRPDYEYTPFLTDDRSDDSDS
ncbi:hypothetical protein Clacol_001685 [Clathrus columnatus]|uniref:SSD domain-containing protein n=1 Tax=Clathrus columnatus TaxID=1419009 RepID=A0AAV5A4A9_9AGAM|nr:hypothetical protein Clacol_001685 [Clathrus columnatus]